MFVCVGVFLCLCRRQDHSGGIFERGNGVGAGGGQVLWRCGLTLPPGYFGATSTFYLT